MTQRTSEQQADGATLHEAVRAAESLRDRERWFRSLAESLPQLVWMCRPDGGWDYLSPQWIEYTGCPEAKQLGQGWLKQIHPDDRLGTAAAWHGAIAAGVPFDGEFRIHRHDQSYRWFRARAVPQRDEHGRIIRWLGSAADIEEQKQARDILHDANRKLEERVVERTEALRESEAQLRAIIEAEPACVKMLDASCRLLDMNLSGLVLIEADSLEQVRGLSVLELILPAHHQAFLEGIRAVLSGETVLQVFEIQGLRGTRRWMEQRAVAMKGDHHHGPPRIIAITHDITDRLREQRQLRESEERLHLALRASRDAHWDWDLLTEQRYFSPRYWEMLGYSLSEAVLPEQAWSQLVHPDDRSLAEQTLQESLLGGVSSYEVEFRLRHKQGHYVPVLSRGLIERDGFGGAIRVAGVNSDLTDRHRAEAEKRASDERHRVVVTALAEGVVLHGPDGKIQTANPAALRILGVTEEQLLGTSSLDSRWRIIREDGSPYPSEAHPAAVAFTSGQPVLGATMGIHKPNGALVWLSISAQPILGEDGKTVTGVAVSLVDVTERKRVLSALRQAREGVDNASEGIFWITREGRIVEVNPAGCRSLGYTREEALNLSLLDVDFAHNVELWPKHWERLYQLGALTYETQLFRKDGSLVPVEVACNLVTFDDEDFICAFVRDITQRKGAEEELHEKTIWQEAMLEHAAHGIIATTPDGVIRTVNPAAVRLFGYAAEELIDRSTPVLLHDAGEIEHRAAQFSQELGFEVQPGFEALIAQARHGLPNLHEWTYIRKDGSRFEGLTAATALRNSSGRITGFLKMVLDVSDRKRAAQELAAHAEMMRAVAGVAGLGAWELDTLTHQARRSRELCDILGVELPESPSLDDGLAFHTPENRSLVEGHVVGAIQHATPFDFEIAYPHPKLGTRALRIVGRPISRQGRVERLVGFVQDITARKQEEAQRQELEESLQQADKLSAVGRLAGGVAHDFNNMLGVIFASVDEALETLEPDAPAREDIEEISRAARRSADLTDQLLAFARKQPIAPRVIDLTISVAAMLTMLRRLIGEDIALDWKPDTSPCWVMMDPGQLDQLLANLLVNARDAISGVGHIVIETRLEMVEPDPQTLIFGAPPERRVVLSVSDDGCGMDQSTIDRIFEPFFTTKPQGEGTGLGLATVYGIVSQNHGTIRVESAVRLGSRFSVTLPYRVPTPSVLPASSSANIRSAGTETVLLVEDEPALLRLNKRMLERLGYQVIEASGPEEALRLSESYGGPIHLLFTDVVMPRMSGLELQQRLQGTRPGLKCLFVSGYPMDVLAQRGVLEKDIHFLAKPFSRDACAAKLLEVLGRAT